MYLHIYFLKGNQNENVQEPFEQKNNNARLTEYSNMRTEDDSHFFIYFVIILACLAGYIGYHNKQKVSLIYLYLYLTFIIIFDDFLMYKAIFLCFRYLLLYWRVEDQEIIVVDGDQVQPATESWIVHLKKLLLRNVVLMLLMSYINANRSIINFLISIL